MRRLAAATAIALLSTAFLLGQAPAAPVVPPQETVPFLEGTPFAYLDVQRVVAESALGQDAARQVQALQQQRVAEMNQRNQELQASQQRLEAGTGVLSPQAIAQLQRDIERLQVDLQRFTEDAQAEVQALQQQLLADINQRLQPIVQQVFEERGLQMLFDVADPVLVWWNPAVDLTSEVIERFDQANPVLPSPVP